jgi:DNA-binding NtrC family response regulator
MWQLFINFVLKINPAQKFIRSYSGLAVVTLDIPPMRERREDIPHLADFF